MKQTTAEHESEQSTDTRLERWKRLVRLIDKSEITYGRVEEYINSDLNLQRVKQGFPETIKKPAVTNHVKLSPIIYIDVPASLKGEAEDWAWEVLEADVPYHDGRSRFLQFLYPDFGSTPVIHYWCVTIKTYLVSGDSGFWIMDDNLRWRGFVGTSWEEVKPRMMDCDLWTSIGLFETTDEQFKQAYEMVRRETPPLTEEENAMLAEMGDMRESRYLTIATLLLHNLYNLFSLYSPRTNQL
jgi:hypothetical protein